VPPPKWLTPLFYGFLAIRNERSDDYPIDDVSQSPYGANMAIKRNVIERVGPFDTSRGRNGKVLASGEDGEMFERIIKAGFKVIFLGGARVHHKVEAFRLEKRYFRRWRYQTSRNIAITQDFPGTNRILNVPLYLVPQLLRALWRGASSRLSLPADRAFAQELLIFHFLGIVAGLLARRNQICRVEPRKIG
jgi:GT2 family glycosyltransferase